MALTYRAVFLALINLLLSASLQFVMELAKFGQQPVIFDIGGQSTDHPLPLIPGVLHAILALIRLQVHRDVYAVPLSLDLLVMVHSLSYLEALQRVLKPNLLLLLYFMEFLEVQMRSSLAAMSGQVFRQILV